MSDPGSQDRLVSLLSGFWHTQAISVAAKLGLADRLAGGPRPAAELAADTGTDPRALYRLLRALASLGIFTEDEQHRFGLTPLADGLREDVGGSVRALAIMRGEWQYAAWGELLYSVRTGRPAFEKLYGRPLFEYLAEHPEQGRTFDAAMTGVHGRETDAILEAYDFTGIGTLADVGGGNGSLLAAILRRYPAVRGLLFDLPAVAERARGPLGAAGLAERCRVVGGNFFEAVPAGADAYLLRHVLHDWDDDRSRAILRGCHRALSGRGRVLVAEGLVPPGNEPSLSKYFDLAMLVLPGGLERTEEEYRQLFADAGFNLSRVVPTSTWVSVLEGEPQ